MTMISPSNRHPMLACGHAANAVRNSKGGIKYDPPIPCCVICSCDEVSLKEPDLTGRKARCCSEKSEKISSTNLAFFEYRGPGSKAATKNCKNCGYAEIAHKPDRKNKNICDQFQPRGPWEFDLYYCGCRGWD